MIDKELILAKASSVQKHIRRVKEKREVDLQTFLSDLDRQESILFNFQMAIQNCIDMAAHVVSAKGLGIPGSTNEMYYILEENGYIGRDLTENLVKAVGLRNLIVHEYGRIDLHRVFNVAHENIGDLNLFIEIMIKQTDS